jgi:hypothetical protein
MSSKLTTSAYREYLPPQLLEHLAGEEVQDRSVNYSIPNINTTNRPLKKKTGFSSKPSDVRLPARISSPLIPYPKSLQEYAESGNESQREVFHGHHSSQLDALRNSYEELVSRGIIPSAEIRYDIDSLKRFARQSYSSRESLIKSATSSFAKRATRHDLSIAAGTDIPFETTVVNSSQYLPMIIMIQRLRIHIAKEKTFPKLESTSIGRGQDEASYQMYDNGVYLYGSANEKHDFAVLACGGHFRMYHRSLGYWFAGPISYLDYIFSIADILNNLDVLKACDEYSWAVEVFNLMIEFAEIEGHHNLQVDFMKGIEGLFLNMSDYDEDFAMNWKPLLVTTNDLWKLDLKISGVSYDYAVIFCLLRGAAVYYPPESFMCRFIVSALKLTRLQRQEISALHKLIFYAEVDAQAGVMKFLKRVHTPRDMDKGAIKNLTRLAKQLFLLSYVKKHKVLPNTIGPVQKVKLLETYVRMRDLSQVENLPLSWWDELRIYNCMDNTLTNDPLEFAKDKGALKKKISFGPGDSRKELLQVIEKEQYELEDFFQSRTFSKVPQSVVRTSQLEDAVDMRYPARLIEKEREQKIEARLFANAELSDKHSLSLVAARMKKALAYFDEQLMTPSDRKRKGLIHDASRELAMPDNYSLLLDIEGHNQSMQYENTTELCEFLGNLFGFDSWGDLPLYFSNLNVYHYDEYRDDVIHSQGQLGGIEGWLNPLWTLHTTLMMKLMRIMTDLTIPKIMVYSDDVNAIVSIRQASEAMVQSVFLRIMQHCYKFGMIVKYSQTMMSKHRVTMLRQHYADGERADSTLKRLISMSAGNNPVLVSDELEVAGISSASSSALELSNHNEACSYLKNYKLGLLLVRLPHMVLSRDNENSMVGSAELPKKLVNILYYHKDDRSDLRGDPIEVVHRAAVNDIAAYLQRTTGELNMNMLNSALQGVYGRSVNEERTYDAADRTLYLQIYDDFIADLLFFWTYLPCNLGGLGGSLHINLVLSGHSVGFTKSLHYLFEWVKHWSYDRDYFFRYLSSTLSIDDSNPRNFLEERLVMSNWPSENSITPATTSIKQAIKHVVRQTTRNANIRKLFELSDEKEGLASEYVDLFRTDFHSRIAQFYHENTSAHFVDLLLNKVETSSGLILKVRNITRLRVSMASRAVDNIRTAAQTSKTYYFMLSKDSDIVESLCLRKYAMFPKISFVKVEEILYDDKMMEVDANNALVTIRRCAPTHYRSGIRVYDDPKVGNETLYKGELLDDNRMLGHKEELLAAKLVAVTKWFLTKTGNYSALGASLTKLNVVKACNLSLSTLTGQSFSELCNFAPTETGGEILHRIPNLRFSTATYIRSEMNKSLNYTSDLNQQSMIAHDLVDSNVNVDYMRMRFLVSAIIRDKYSHLRRLVMRYGFRRFDGIKDVQFVVPKYTEWEPRGKYSPYGAVRGHVLSLNRFRYLAHSYMFEENMNEWALMPTENELKTSKHLGRSYITDIVLKYARDLDKDYMLLDHNTIDKDVWKPLKEKLDRVDKSWNAWPELDGYSALKRILAEGMTSRSRWSLVDPKNKVTLELQGLCLEQVRALKPKDESFDALSNIFSRMNKARRYSKNLTIRLSQYQQDLANFERHKRKLALYLLAEYAITFHFKASSTRGELQFSVVDSLVEMGNTGVGALSAMLCAPHLQFQILILGIDYVSNVLASRRKDLQDLLEDVSKDVSFADIEMPVSLPSLAGSTMLTGQEPIPDYLDEIEYASIKIPEYAMQTLSDITPLCKFAHRCSTSGALPETFTSFTGSDSLGAQVGLFKLLRNEEMMDEFTSICDLTAGRGDGQYAMQHLGLSGTSYSRPDTFTRLQYHPDIEFKNDYDIFDGATLKFITRFDHVHIDVSFTGGQGGNVLDLILLMEEHNLQYSIRLNSVDCKGYTPEITRDLPAYEHKIAYCTNSTLKPYQIYLIGTPADTRPLGAKRSLRETIAYRSMTLSFARLLSPKNYLARLEHYEPNSMSIQLPKGRELDRFLTSIGDLSIFAEQRYYLDRYVAEIGEDLVVAVSLDKLNVEGRKMVTDRTRIFSSCSELPYGRVEESQIGNVSSSIRQFHWDHITALSMHSSPIVAARIIFCDDALLKYMRSRHPIQEIRSACNVMLGLRQFCRSNVLAGHASLIELYDNVQEHTSVRQSLHQKELFTAIKLLFLSAKRDNFGYGVYYCKALITRAPKNSTSMQRTLRIYRLLSYLYSYIQYQLRCGNISIHTLDAMENELEVREAKRYKYKRQDDAPPTQAFDGELEQLILGDKIDQLFVGLEQYAQSLVEVGTDVQDFANLEQTLQASNLVFDIGIENRIDQMVQRLGLIPSGPHGFIDLGDSDIIEADDW